MKSNCFLLTVALSISFYYSACTGYVNTEKNYSVYSPDIDPIAEQHQKTVDSIFIIGYQLYDNFEYEQALSVFEELIKRDTSLLQYEGYAFAADCFDKLSKRESGLSLYDSLINRFSARLKNDSDSYDLKISLEESKYMRSQYPSLPSFLQKENGFIPYDSIPKVISSKPPLFPESARRDGMQGRVKVRVRLSGSGRIEKVKVLESSHTLFTQSVVDILQYWRFTPYKRKGRLSKVEIFIPFKFRFNPGP